MTSRDQLPEPTANIVGGNQRQPATHRSAQRLQPQSPGTLTAEQGRKASPGAIDLLHGRAFEEQTLTAHSYDLYEENEDGYTESWPGRLPSSSRRYLTHAGQGERPRRTDDYPQASPPRRKTTVDVRAPAKETRRLRRTHFHWFVFVGLAMFIMIIGWLSFSALSSWWSVQVDDWHYGRPRTAQYDAVVGHNDSQQNPSHFIAMNLHGKVIVIEFPGGDVSRTKVYVVLQLFGSGQDLAAVTLSFEDRNGDGKPDLNIHIEGSDQVIVFRNDGKEFVSPQQQ